MRLRFSIRAYMLAVVFVTEIVSLYKLIPRAIRTYQPSASAPATRSCWLFAVPLSCPPITIRRHYPNSSHDGKAASARLGRYVGVLVSRDTCASVLVTPPAEAAVNFLCRPRYSQCIGAI